MIGGNEFNECKKDKKGIEVKDLGSAKGYMLCWNDGSDDVGLVEWPDYSRKSDKYSSTALAYWTHVREMTEVQLTAYLFLASMHLIVRDNVPHYAVHNCLMQLKEYRRGVAEDMHWIYSESGKQLEYIKLDD